MFVLVNSKMVNHCTHPEGPTYMGTIACTNRSSERVGAEIINETFMDRLTNLNSKVGLEVSLPYRFKSIRKCGVLDIT